MVIKGGARSGPGELALHLLRADTNESVTVRGLDGVAADDLRSALLEMAAVGAGARTQRPLYHASINTARDELMTDAQKARAVERLADELGLAGQPHVVVEHVKANREHLHVVWSRIDGETLKAIPDSHNYRRHELVARDLELEFSHQRVQGAHVGREGIDRPVRTPEPYEMMQAARSSLSPAEATAELTGLWRSTDSGQAFVSAIEDAGWRLARGDKRDFVVIDPHGETHSLARRIDGVKAKDIRDRLADIDPAGVPGVDQVRAALRDRQAERERVTVVEPVPDPHAEIHAEATPAPAMSPEDRRRQWAAELRELAPRPDAAPEPVRQDAREENRGRLAALIDAAKTRLASLAGRLESAFEPFRHRWERQAEECDRPMRPGLEKLLQQYRRSKEGSSSWGPDSQANTSPNEAKQQLINELKNGPSHARGREPDGPDF